MKNIYDIIIIGAGSIGTPLSFYLSKEKFKVLVIEKEVSPGRGQNRAAIGGVRATHSEFAKIKIGLKSIEEFSNFHQKYGIDIDWFSGGYLYPIYTENDRKNVLELLMKQKEAGLNINWIEKDSVKELVPNIDEINLLGGIYSPEDGNCSPLKSNFAYFKLAKENGVEFLFNKKVDNIIYKKNKNNDIEIVGVKISNETFHCNTVINCSGIDINDPHKNLIEEKILDPIPILADCHEAGITEPVKKWFNPLIVDIRPYKESKNFYFYQNNEGQIIFCLTPEPPIYCTSNLPTESFMLLSAQRFNNILPSISNLRIRRTWRGYYPNSPDGSPIIDEPLKNYIIIGGLCGQGFMFGPGISILIVKKLTDKLSEDDKKVLYDLRLSRSFNKKEFFK
ncbi:MAG: FAD-binding oxidoreductase [Spirochaetes bacterium]|nr:FAD-binding oxidoreductase [Spirochaetota bacterium]